MISEPTQGWSIINQPTTNEKYWRVPSNKQKIPTWRPERKFFNKLVDGDCMDGLIPNCQCNSYITYVLSEINRNLFMKFGVKYRGVWCKRWLNCNLFSPLFYIIYFSHHILKLVRILYYDNPLVIYWESLDIDYSSGRQ